MSNPNTVNQPGENSSTSEWDSLKDIKFNDAEAQAQRTPQINPDVAKTLSNALYKSEHPGAIDDVEKARAMAEAEDPHMEKAIEGRDKLKFAATEQPNGDWQHDKKLREAQGFAKGGYNVREETEEEFRRRIPPEQQLSYMQYHRSPLTTGSYKPASVEEYLPPGKEVVQQHIEDAHAAADAAADRYDQNKATIDEINNSINGKQ